MPTACATMSRSPQSSGRSETASGTTPAFAASACNAATSPALTAILSGETQAMVVALPGAVPQIKSGRLRALGISSTKRLPLLHELNTIAEAGLPGYEASVIHGICVTAKTPPALVARLHRELVAAITVPEVRERLAAIGAEVLASTPEEYQAATRAEIKRWRQIIKTTGMSAN